MPIFKPINRTAYLVKPRYVPFGKPTRFYIDTSGVLPAISPSYDSTWNNTTYAATRKKLCVDTPAAEVHPLRVEWTENVTLYGLGQQLISPPLSPNQTLKSFNIRGQFVTYFNVGPPDFCLGIRVLGADGTTVRTTLLAVTRDTTATFGVADRNTTINYTATFSDYTPIVGDRLVIEIGGYKASGLPGGFQGKIELGSNTGTDLGVNENFVTSSQYGRPWIEFNTTVLFDPEYIAAVTLASQPATITASATYSSPTRTATVALESQTSSIAASATFTKPVYTAGAALTAEPSTLEANASFYLPTRTATVSLASQAASIAALVEVINNDSVQSSIWMQLNRILQEAKPLFSTFCDPQA